MAGLLRPTSSVVPPFLVGGRGQKTALVTKTQAELAVLAFVRLALARHDPNHADVSDLLARWAHLGRTCRAVQRVAAGMRSAGLEPNDRIAVLDLNHPGCLEFTTACAQTGCAKKRNSL
jgi:hypothetical protein